MPFSNRAALERMAREDHIPKVLLFAGERGTGKMAMANSFISTFFEKALSEDHPDVRIYAPESKAESYTVSQIDDFIKEVALLPFEAKRRFFIFKDAHKFQNVHANRLLKSFEEMPDHAHVILIALDPRMLLDTIVSRSIVFRFFPLQEESLILEDRAIKEAIVGAILSMYADQIDKAFSFLDQIEALAEQERSLVFETALDKIRFFVRDLHYFKETKETKLLYYPEHQAVIEKIIQSNIPSLESVKKIIFNAIDGFDKHIKIKTILQQTIAQITSFVV